jgi:hypothetical protein
MPSGIRAARELGEVADESMSAGWTEVTFTVPSRVHAVISAEVGAAPTSECGVTTLPPFGEWDEQLPDEAVRCPRCLLLNPLDS